MINEEHNPLKQGLKQEEMERAEREYKNEEHNPLKQGLKREDSGSLAVRR